MAYAFMMKAVVVHRTTTALRACRVVLDARPTAVLMPG
jgi:hypothetical protein